MANIKTVASMILAAGLTSCLGAGLEELETYDGTAIQSISGVYYRYYSDDVNPGTGELKINQVTLNQTAEIDEDAGTVNCTVSIPSSVPVDAVNKLSLAYTQGDRTGINVVVNLSAAAVIKPLDGAPALGAPGDWSRPNRYLVTAANGDTQEWTITLNIQRSDRELTLDSAAADNYYGNAVYDASTGNWKFGYVFNNEAYLYLTFKSTTGGRDTPPSGTLTKDMILAATWGGNPVTISECNLTLTPDEGGWWEDGGYTICNYQLHGKVVGDMHKYSSMIWNFDAGLLTDDDGYQYGSAWMYYDLQ